MEFDPNVVVAAATGKPMDLMSTLFKFGNDFGVGIKDLPGLIKSLGDTARELKELNREMPILQVIEGLKVLIDSKDEVASLMEVMKDGIRPEENSSVRPARDGKIDSSESDSD